MSGATTAAVVSSVLCIEPHDFASLPTLFSSLQKYQVGRAALHRFVVVTPRATLAAAERELLAIAAANWPDMGTMHVVADEDLLPQRLHASFPSGWHRQQVVKLLAAASPQLVGETADFVLLLDADTFAVAPFTAEDLCPNGRARVSRCPVPRELAAVQLATSVFELRRLLRWTESPGEVASLVLDAVGGLWGTAPFLVHTATCAQLLHHALPDDGLEAVSRAVVEGASEFSLYTVFSCMTGAWQKHHHGPDPAVPPLTSANSVTTACALAKLEPWALQQDRALFAVVQSHLGVNHALVREILRPSVLEIPWPGGATPPLVRMVMAVRTAAQFRTQLLVSAQDQLYPNWELVVVTPDSVVVGLIDERDDPRMRALHAPGVEDEETLFTLGVKQLPRPAIVAEARVDILPTPARLAFQVSTLLDTPTLVGNRLGALTLAWPKEGMFSTAVRTQGFAGTGVYRTDWLLPPDGSTADDTVTEKRLAAAHPVAVLGASAMAAVRMLDCHNGGVPLPRDTELCAELLREFRDSQDISTTYQHEDPVALANALSQHAGVPFTVYRATSELPGHRDTVSDSWAYDDAGAVSGTAWAVIVGLALVFAAGMGLLVYSVTQNGVSGMRQEQQPAKRRQALK